MTREESGWQIPATDQTPMAKRLATVWHIDKCLPYVRDRHCVVQAGGNLGQWPAYLARLFEEVHTFEASRENYACLAKNISNLRNVMHRHAALGGEAGKAQFAHDPENCEAGHVSADGYEVPMIAIDHLGLRPSLILLDVEGAELEALKGAGDTLRANAPVVLCEVRHGPTATELLDYLRGLNERYRLTAIAAHDAIFTVPQ